MPPNQIKDSVESGLKGSGNGPYDLFMMILSTALLPLLVLFYQLLERRKSLKKGMNPFAGAILTCVAASVGFALWAVPVSILASIGCPRRGYWLR